MKITLTFILSSVAFLLCHCSSANQEQFARAFALGLSGSDANQEYIKAQNAYNNKNYDSAIYHFENVLIFQPNDYTAHSMVALSYYEKGNFHQAIEHQKKAIAINPNDADGYALAGLYMYLNKDYSGAKDYLKTSLSLNPNNDVARNRLLEIERAQDSNRNLFEQANVFLNNAQYKKAIPIYQQYINSNPSTEQQGFTYVNMGVCYFNLKNYREADIYCTNALLAALAISSSSKNSSDYITTRAYTIRGIISQNELNYNQALEYFNEAIKTATDPELKSEIYSSRGLVFLKQGRYQQALQDQNLSISLTKNVNAKMLGYYNIACTYSLQRQEQLALRYLSLAIDNGYRNVSFIEKDQDFNFIRNTNGYAALLSRMKNEKHAVVQKKYSNESQSFASQNQPTQPKSQGDSLKDLGPFMDSLHTQDSWRGRDINGESHYDYTIRSNRESIEAAK